MWLHTACVWIIPDVLALAELHRVVIVAFELLGCILDEPAQMHTQVVELSSHFHHAEQHEMAGK